MKKCLMIELSDKRKFFTHEEHYTDLLRFVNTFNAEISTVKIEDNEPILELQPLAEAVTDQTVKIKKPNYEVLETRIERKKRKSL